MNIIKKMMAKTADHMKHEGVTIAFLGDSVTQGCFELYKEENNQIETLFDQTHSYARALADMLGMLFPRVPVNVINAGISGDRASGGAARVERDVLRHEPDLTVVCYGLNDCSTKEESIYTYIAALREIFQKVLARGGEVVFMTPNMMNTKVSPHLTDPDFIRVAVDTAHKQNSGLFDAHIEAAKTLCLEMKVPVCDCYAIWRMLDRNGVEVTELLANKINHPTREMNRVFAYELIKVMMEN